MSTTLARIFGLIPQLQAHLLDPSVTEIMVNRGRHAVFIERHGYIERTDITLNGEALESAIVRIAHFCNDDISEEQPLLDGRLEDGQQYFHAQKNVTYVNSRNAALVEARALVLAGRRIFLVNIDRKQWSEVSN